jgi:hypothetical protein
MVACDGNRSPVREALGIAMQGHAVMSNSITIYFRADCSSALRGRNLGVIYVNNPKIRGFFRLEKTGLGGFLVIFTAGDIHSPAARNVASDLSVERAVQHVRDAVGDPDLAVQVEDVASWVARRRTLWPGPGVHRRRRCSPHAADRWFQREHWRPGRAQSGLENRLRDPW